jgi:hypothetical protein
MLRAAPVGAADTVIVNWGGDYVTFDNNLRGYITDEYPVNLDGTNNDARSYCPYSDTVPLHPPTEYTAGSSYKFYGGVLLLKYNGGTFGRRWAEIWSGSSLAPRDKLYYGVGTNDHNTVGYDFRFWKKEDFLNGAQNGTVTFSATSKLEVLNYEGGDGVPANNYGRVRFVVKDGNQFYVSEDFGGPASTTTSFVLTDPGSRRWALYNPSAPYNIQFNSVDATFAPHTFANITAAGYYHSNDNSTDLNRKAGFNAERFRVTADVNSGLPPNQKPTITAITADPPAGPGPRLTVSFQATATDPENDPLTYSWTFGDNTSATGAMATHTYGARGLYAARVTVSDGRNQVVSNPIVITIGTPPNVFISAPVDGALFRAGDSVFYQGSASDPDGPLTPANFSWRVDLLHDQRMDLAAGPVGGQDSGSFVVPTTGQRLDDSTAYQITLTVTDADGLQASRSVIIRPDTVNLAFTSSPSGLAVVVDGVTLTTPVASLNVVRNFQVAVSTPSPQRLGTTGYTFAGWSDGQPQAHTIIVPASNQSYAAQFAADIPAPTASISVSPSAISAGSAATLTWSTTNATSVSIDQGIDSVPGSGSRTVSPSVAGTYVVTATNSTGTAQASASIIVTAPPVPTSSLTASPEAMTSGSSSTLVWSTTNATTVTIDQGIGTVSASGSRAVSPTATTTYTLSAMNASGSVTAQKTISVTAPPPPGTPVSVVVQVNNASDDVNEVNGVLEGNASTAWLGNGGSANSFDGFRFSGVSVPRGAAIAAAHLDMYSAQDQWIGVAFTIAGDSTGNSAPFTNSARPSQRPLTTANVAHSSNSRWLPNTWYSLNDIKTIIQEIVNRPDWQAGNTLSIVLRGTASGVWSRKFVKSFEAGASTAPKLVITYSE